MTRPNPATCPLCGQPNRCAMASGASCEACWCAEITIDKTVTDRIPAEALGVACVCAACAGAADKKAD